MAWTDWKKWWTSFLSDLLSSLIANVLLAMVVGVILFKLQAEWQESNERSRTEWLNSELRRQYLAEEVVKSTRELRSRFVKIGWEYIEGQRDAMIDVYDHGHGNEKKSQDQRAYEGRLHTDLIAVGYEANGACTFDGSSNEKIRRTLNYLDEAKTAAYRVYDDFEDQRPQARARHRRSKCPDNGVPATGAFPECVRHAFEQTQAQLKARFLEVDNALSECIAKAEREYLTPSRARARER